MVHNTNGSSYSVRPDGFGQRRVKTKCRSCKSSSRKTHLEDARVSPHFQRSAPTKYDVNSEYELIHDNISRAEPFSSGRNRSLSMAIQELVQRSQRGGVGNMPKPLAGSHELLLPDEELSGSGETIELLGAWITLSCKEKVKKIENLLKNKSLFSIDQKKELEMTPALEKKGPVASTSSKPAAEVSKDKHKGPQKKQKGPKIHQGKGKSKTNWHRPYPQGYRIRKLEPSAMDSVVNMARTLISFIAKEKERVKRTFEWK
ncbi:hypothetical protein O181_082616 [Austropuccinia psidii MF-1]|uniref:Uncharacterized protein n=1 Tax=Austropuccinia psidii MF-1 TaxID=1389203 RepID=A0A9Q3FSY6_9BASI|nr:hypothetical protein [Austropuccinia psidii MF-1]